MQEVLAKLGGMFDFGFSILDFGFSVALRVWMIAP
jgi:hypothetical protein